MHYTLVHGFCLFKLFLIGCIGLKVVEIGHAHFLLDKLGLDEMTINLQVSHATPMDEDITPRVPSGGDMHVSNHIHSCI